MLWLARRFAQLRLRLAEGVVDEAWDPRASCHVDAAIILLEELDG